MAVRAAAVGRIDRIDVAIENPCPFVYVFRIGRIRRSKLRGDREAARTQHALEPSRRGMTRKNGQGIAGYDRFVVELHAGACGAPPDRAPVFSQPFSRATRRHDAAGDAPAAFEGLDPNAGHVLDDFAIAVGPYAAAWPVAQGLRTVHRTG